MTDFRGYVQSQNPSYLGVIGNDYTAGGSTGVNKAKLLHQVGNSQGLYNTIIGNLDKLYQSYNAQKSGGRAGGVASPAPVYAPKLDLAGINASARSAAEGAVNPYYSKVLGEFLTQQGALKQRQQTQYDTNIKNLEDTLKQNLEANQTSRTRAGEDATLGQQQVNTTADQYQTDTGQAFAKDRLATAKATAESGLTGGLGAQQGEQAQTTRNTTEQRQEQGFTQQRNAIDLSKVRTFEDLGRSDVLAGTATEKGKKQEKVGLDNFLQDAAFQEQNKRNELEQQRQAAIQENAKQQAKLQFNNYLAHISNPAQYLAAVQTYGGSF